MKLAENGIEELQQYVDTLLTIPNQNLFRIANEKTTFSDAFKMADDVLYAGVRGVTDLMVQPGMINLDFSDVKTVMSEMGKAMMGTGEASGEGRAVAAAEAAIANPLIDDVSLKGAKGLIINITGGKDITLYEVDEAANRIKQEVDEEANIIYGTTCDDRLDGLVRVSIVATGIDSNLGMSAKPLENFASININNDVYKSSKINEEQEIDTQILANIESDQEVDESDNLDINEEKSENIEIQDVNMHNISQEDQEGTVLDTNLSETLDVEKELTKSNLDDVDIKTIIESDINNSEEENEINDNNIIDDQKDKIIEKDHELANSTESSVRRLSLFDNISSNISDNSFDENEKNEPIISENNHEIEKNENLGSNYNDESNPEFNATSDELDEEFNQENEEELLDIPTFLRRQAN